MLPRNLYNTETIQVLSDETLLRRYKKQIDDLKSQLGQLSGPTISERALDELKQEKEQVCRFFRSMNSR